MSDQTYWYAPSGRRPRKEKRVHTNPNCPPLASARKVREATDHEIETYDLCQICSGEAKSPSNTEYDWSTYRKAVEYGRRENPKPEEK